MEALFYAFYFFKSRNKLYFSFMFRHTLFLIVGLFIWLCQSVLGQGRVSYVELLRSERQSQIYFEHLLTPSSDSLTDLSVLFRIENDYLTFTKKRDNTYRSEIKGSVEIFDSTGMVIRTAFWNGEKQVNSYEKTQVRDEFMIGRIHTELPAGKYSYQLKFQGSNQRREISSNKIKFEINPKKAVWFYMLNDFNTPLASNLDSLTLINYGGNAVYGKNFILSATISAAFIADTSQKLSYKLTQLDIDEKDTTEVKTVIQGSIQPENVFADTIISIVDDTDLTPKVKSNKTYITLFIPIENKKYPNSNYRLDLFSQDSLLSSKIYQSFWYDIPLSLLNLDVSVSMLKFILPPEKIKPFFSENEQKKSEAFFTFWKEKDPTPESDFNELMYEYYKRIDFAFKEFSSPSKPGFDTDMGKIFVVYGPPIRKDRTLPSNGFVVETWVYSNRSFSFQATNGFGDFELKR